MSLPTIRLSLKYGWKIEDLTACFGSYEVRFRKVGRSPNVENPDERRKLATAKFIPPSGQYHWTIFCLRQHTILRQGISDNLAQAFDDVDKEIRKLSNDSRRKIIKHFFPSAIAKEIGRGKHKEEIWQKLVAAENPKALFRGMFNHKEFKEAYQIAKRSLNRPPVAT